VIRQLGAGPVQHRGPSQAAEIGLRVRPWLSYPTNSRSLSRVSSSVESAIDRSIGRYAVLVIFHRGRSASGTAGDPDHGYRVSGLVDLVQDPVGAPVGAVDAGEVIAQRPADSEWIFGQHAVDEFDDRRHNPRRQLIRRRDSGRGQPDRPSHLVEPMP